MRIVLVDCENLTSARHRALVFRWRGFERVELFGRARLLAGWRAAFAAEQTAVTAEWPLPEDAPPQAADAEIVARAEALAGERPDRLVIASDDLDFVEPLARLAAVGFAAEQHRSPGVADLLRLLVEAEAESGWADAARIGTVMAERFGIRLKGRLDPLARKAGLAVGRGPAGQLRLYCNKLRST